MEGDDAPGDGGTDDLGPDQAFGLLGNELRMAILRELWAEYEPLAAPQFTAMSFSELRERVGVSDPGQFNYHLNRLVGPFLRRSEAGYTLRPNAVGILRAVGTQSVTGHHSLAATPADDPCPLCGGDVEVTVAADVLVVRCTACEGEYLGDSIPAGTLMASSIFPPAGVGDRSGQALWEAIFDHLATEAFGFLRGICPTCASTVTPRVDVCADHDPAGICETCGSTQVGMAMVHCEACRFAWRVPAWVAALTHPSVVAFFHDRGRDAVGGLTFDMYTTFLQGSQRVHSVDPPTFEVAVAVAGDDLVVTVDGGLAVTAVQP